MRLFGWLLIAGVVLIPVSPIILAMIFMGWLVTAPIHMPLRAARRNVRKHW